MFFLSRYRKCEDGVAAVEAALVFPVLITIGFGAMDASILLMQNHKLSTSLSSAANYMAYANAPRLVEANAKNIALTGELNANANPLISSMSPSDISITYKDIANPEVDGVRDYRGEDVVRLVEISASTPYKGIGFLRTVTGGNIAVAGRFETRLVRVKTW
jgi:hypothetical protein